MVGKTGYSILVALAKGEGERLVRDIPPIHLLIQVGNAVFNSEDIHQLLAERAGNCSVRNNVLLVLCFFLLCTT